MSKSVLVIGAGVIGMASAYALARRGAAVTIVECQAEPGLGTSFANGAQLSYAFTDAFASPGLIRRMPWILAGRDPAFRVRAVADPDLLRWGLAFLRNATAERFTANTLAGLKLGLESRLAMHDLLARHPLEFGHATPGKLILHDDPGSLRKASRLAEAKSAAGAGQWLVSGAEMLKIEPALTPVRKRVAGAIWSPDEEVGDPYLFCAALLNVLQSNYSVSTRFGNAVERIDLGDQPRVTLASGEQLRADQLIVCTGPQARALLRTLGLRVPILPIRGHSLTAPPGPGAPRVSITDAARKLVFCRLGDSIRIAGQADAGMIDAAVSPARLKSLVETARVSLPDAALYHQPTSTWAGLRPVTPDSLPRVERQGSVTINVGHGGLGWTYAMGSAERAAALVMGP